MTRIRFNLVFYKTDKKAVLSRGEPRDAAVNFDTRIEFYSGILLAVCLLQHGFLADLRLQTAVNHLSKSDKYCTVLERTSHI